METMKNENESCFLCLIDWLAILRTAETKKKRKDDEIVISLLSVKICLFCQVFCTSIGGHTSCVQDSQNDLILETNYVSIKYNKAANVISAVSADFQGEKKFSQNLLTLPLQLEVIQEDGTASEKLKLRSESVFLQGVEEELSSLRHSVVMKAIIHYENVPTIEQSMTITVDENLRSVEVLFDGKILSSFNATALTYSYYGNNPSIYGFYESGVVQMMGQIHSCFGSNDRLERAYVLGDGSALDLLFSSSSSGSASSSETVLISNTQAKDNYKTGIQYVLFGNYPNKAKEMSLAWNSLCWKTPFNSNLSSSIITIEKDDSFHFNLTLIPNNYDFPVFLLNNILENHENIPFLDLRTSLTGIYGSAVGCLESYYNNQIGIIAPTIAHPDIGYSPNTNFFDPDNFITLSAMLYSGDLYLISQVKNILQRTSQTMCGIGSDIIPAYCNQQRQRTKHEKMLGFRRYNVLMKEEKEMMIQTALFKEKNFLKEWKPLYDSTSRSGQLMHHFIDLVPTYESIAGSEQLGPNIFWTMTVLKYLSLTQDNDFAIEIFPFIDLSCKYILSFIDNELFMINAPGPLWIDVLIREQYTSDSNTMIIPFLDEMIQFYSYIDRLSVVSSASSLVSSHGDFKDFVSELQDLRSKIIESVNKYLWISNIPSSPKSHVNDTNDHFVTQLDINLKTYRDFIDYDSNLMTIAFGIVKDPLQMERILKRVDSGPFTHVRATWCSEIPYSGDADDCYIVGGSVCGDSISSNCYIDAIARKVVGDFNTYQNLLLLPLQNDLISDVWLYERYDANGQQIRTSYYFEYPSLIAMMIREISYGIEVKLNEVIINPFVMKSSFTYNIGNNFYVSYRNSSYVELQSRQLLNQSNDKFRVEKIIKVYGLVSSSSYQIVNSCDNTRSIEEITDSNGLLQFSMKLVDGCSIVVSQ
jgi:hypothetical protein